MRRVLAGCWLLGWLAASQVQAGGGHAHGSPEPWPLEQLPALTSTPAGQVTSIVLTTQHPPAQQFFDYGLSALHSFAYLEAYRAFAQALRVDPDLAMAHWGRAYSLLGAGKTGAVLDEIVSQAVDALGRVSDTERLYIKALAAYTRSDEDYIGALELLIERFPDELDGKLLLAAFLNDGYDRLGRPKGRQGYGKALLQPLLEAYPHHVGVHHYWVHANEGGAYPQRAAQSIGVLEQLNSPFGHIVHMPGHLAWLGGHYGIAVEHFRAAEAVDLAFLTMTRVGPDHYWSYLHNMAYLVVAELESGNSAAANAAVARVASVYASPRSAVRSPQWQRFQSRYASQVLLRAGQWHTAAELLEALSPEDAGHDIRLAHASAMSILNGPGAVEEDAQDALAALAALTSGTPARKANPFYQMLWFEAQAVHQAFDGKGSDAVANFQQALGFEQQVPYEEPPIRVRTVYESAGQTFCHLRAYDAGIAMYKEAIALRAGNGYAIEALIRCLGDAGKAQEVRRYKRELNTVWNAR